ncbi:MAG: helix-turn-helix transcriptional regulator [Lachnospiraceae bacterium]|nr:helix-turn-helix transcriptional regulator [Lachnospiraceae bacterium]
MKNRIKQLRLENRYTQKYLATAIGITQTSLSRIESGLSIPNAQLLIRLSDIFKVSVDYILCRCDHPHSLSDIQIITSGFPKKFYRQLCLLQRLNHNQCLHLEHFLESIS